MAGVEYWMEPFETYWFFYEDVPEAILAEGKYFFRKHPKKVFKHIGTIFFQEKHMILYSYILSACLWIIPVECRHSVRRADSGLLCPSWEYPLSSDHWGLFPRRRDERQRLRSNGHSLESMEETTRTCAPTIREKQTGRNWQRYARERRITPSARQGAGIW